MYREVQAFITLFIQGLSQQTPNFSYIFTVICVYVDVFTKLRDPETFCINVKTWQIISILHF